jgi:acetoin utilization protein AcuB
MSKLTIRSYMSPAPITIGVEQPVATARTLMQEHQIRHLPVLSAGQVVGVVSERDLRLVSEVTRDKWLAIEEVMTPDPLTLSPDTALEWVAMDMARNKYGCAILVEHGRPVGVFTTVDALRALQDLLARARRRKVRDRTRAAAGNA